MRLGVYFGETFLLGRRQKEAETEEKRTHGCLSLRKELSLHSAKGKEEAQGRKELKKDAALSGFLQTPSTAVTEPLWTGKGECLNEVLKAPGSLRCLVASYHDALLP